MQPLDQAVVTFVKPLAVRIDTAAKLAEVSRVTVYGWIKTGKLKTIKAGSDKRILVDELERFLKAGGGDSGNSRGGDRRKIKVRSR